MRVGEFIETRNHCESENSEYSIFQYLSNLFLSFKPYILHTLTHKQHTFTQHLHNKQ